VFDADFKPVGIDNLASAYISGNIDDFVSELEETNQIIKGFGGTRTTNVYRGTAVLKIKEALVVLRGVLPGRLLYLFNTLNSSQMRPKTSTVSFLIISLASCMIRSYLSWTIPRIFPPTQSVQD